MKNQGLNITDIAKNFRTYIQNVINKYRITKYNMKINMKKQLLLQKNKLEVNEIVVI